MWNLPSFVDDNILPALERGDGGQVFRQMVWLRNQLRLY